MKHPFSRASLGVLAGLVAAAPVYAIGDPVPLRLHYQTRLVDATGTPIQNPVLLANFRIYDQPLEGLALYEELRPVKVEQGFLSVDIGEVTALPLALFELGKPLFLGVTFGFDSEMVPRFRLASNPFAVRSASAANADDVPGKDINPNTVSINGQLVIAANGNWVGPLDGIQGPTGPQGPVGPAGPSGPAGPTGAMGPQGPGGTSATRVRRGPRVRPGPPGSPRGV